MWMDILLWGLVAGLTHFVVVGLLYMNPVVARLYREAEGAPALRVWQNQREYLIKMFAGTQVEVFILTGAYLYLRNLFPDPTSFRVALILGGVLAAVRVYPRFWNMWIQTTYPRSLLFVELVNGTLGTFVIVFSLWLLPIS